jgi:hypothetical protein
MVSPCGSAGFNHHHIKGLALMIRTTTALLCLIMITTPAMAAPIPCWKAVAAVKWYGSLSVAEDAARSRGYTEAEITAAHKCFPKGERLNG